MTWRLAALGVALTLIGAVAFLYSARAREAWFDPAPYVEAARGYDVRILRDTWGVPHIYGKRDADAAFGLAYAHAEDDFATIQETIFFTRGRLAAIKGPEAAVTDYLVAATGVWEWIEARYATDLSAETRAMIEGYAAGINYYAALHPDGAWAGLTPVTGQDVAAGFAFRTPFFYGFERHLRELFGDERKRGISTQATDFAAFPETGYSPIGSNAMAVAPSRSADGATRLFINSHQPFAGPVAWYEARIHSDEGWDMAGGIFPGSPVILHGFNADLGWANTVNRPDLVDIYVLKMNPLNDNQYFFEGEWRDLERHEVEIPVRLFGPLVWTFTQTVERSLHGPVIRRPHGVYALHYTGQGEIRQIEAYYRLNRARNFEDFEAALAMQALPSLNYVYADRTGRIAYFYNGVFPDREPGWDWSSYLPGESAAALWTRYLPFSAIPHLIAPECGFVASSNHSPFRVTEPACNLDPADFPKQMGVDQYMTNRGLRAVELLSADRSITRDELLAIKFDRSYSPESELAKLMTEIAAMDFSGDTELMQAQALLRAWNLRLDVDNRAAALAVMTAYPTLAPMIRGEGRGDVVANLRAAIAFLQDTHGRIDPTWGEVQRHRRGRFDLAVGGGPDVLRAMEYPVEAQDDGTYVALGGDSLIVFVEWDAQGRVHAESIHPYGSATLDEHSPHYDDQVELFAQEGFKPVWFGEAEVLAHLERAYRPGEETRP